MKHILACTTTVILTAFLATTTLPATAAIAPPSSMAPVSAGSGAAATGVHPGSVAPDGIRDEFAKLRCLFFRC